MSSPFCLHCHSSRALLPAFYLSDVCPALSLLPHLLAYALGALHTHGLVKGQSWLCAILPL